MRLEYNKSKSKIFDSPAKIMGFTLLTIFMIETLIMQFPLDAIAQSQFMIAVLDSSILSCLVAPLLFKFIYKPMQNRIDELQKSRKALLDSQTQQQIFFEVFQETLESVIVTNAEGNIIAVNPATTKLTGYSEQEMIGKCPNILASGNHDKTFYQQMWSEINHKGHWQGEFHNRKKTGELYIQHTTISKISDNSNGQPPYFVAVFHDITNKKLEEKRLQHHAQHDALTGLPNRALFLDRLSQVISNTRKNAKRTAVLFLDLDHFKPINDTYGHKMGDQLLVAVASAIKQQIRAEDTTSRIGGDEFTIILRNINQKEDAGRLAGKILTLFATPFTIDGKNLSIGVSIGIAIFPDHANTLEKLIEQADTAMYLVKKSGRNNFQYFPETVP